MHHEGSRWLRIKTHRVRFLRCYSGFNPIPFHPHARILLLSFSIDSSCFCFLLFFDCWNSVEVMYQWWVRKIGLLKVMNGGWSEGVFSFCYAFFWLLISQSPRLRFLLAVVWRSSGLAKYGCCGKLVREKLEWRFWVWGLKVCWMMIKRVVEWWWRVVIGFELVFPLFWRDLEMILLCKV